ncbi:squamosa promoter-binding protein [Trifolium repens]|jgi:hypothetical protein|nr:squamosa promoter-binding protein [Trifolium repens]
MTQKGVVEGVWPDIMRGVAKMQVIIKENNVIIRWTLLIRNIEASMHIYDSNKISHSNLQIIYVAGLSKDRHALYLLSIFSLICMQIKTSLAACYI